MDQPAGKEEKAYPSHDCSQENTANASQQRVLKFAGVKHGCDVAQNKKL